MITKNILAEKLKKIVEQIDFQSPSQEMSKEMPQPSAPTPKPSGQPEKKPSRNQRHHKKTPKNMVSSGNASKKSTPSFSGEKPARKRGPRPSGPLFISDYSTSRDYPYPQPLQKDTVRIIPLGGCEEIGKNSTLIEYGNSMIVIDIGLQFPSEQMKGINYVIPDMNYVYKNKHKLKAVIITHGHYDHTGGIPHVMEHLPGVPLYATPLTSAMIAKKQEELGKPLKIINFTANDIFHFGDFKVEFYHVNHTIPDCVAVVVHTPQGTIVHTGDWKYDPRPIGEEPMSWERVQEIGEKHNILALLADSTSVYKKGHQISESDITENIEEIFRLSNGRIIVGTFASLISRLQQIIWLAQKYHRKIVIDGRSMKNNIEISKRLQKLTYHPQIFISPQEMKRYQNHELVIMCTGAQGEEHASLMRIATKRHKFLEIETGDSCIFSSSVIPGNEQSVQFVMDLIYRQGGKVYHYQHMDIHAGGHAFADELIKLYLLLKPKYYIPVHGNHFQLVLNAETVEELGTPRQNIFISDNGQPIEFYADGNASLTKFSTGNALVAVDGLGVGDIGPQVLHDRKIMGENGVFTVILVVDRKTKDLKKFPDVVTRGFVMVRESEELLQEAKEVAHKAFLKYRDIHEVETIEFRNAIKAEVENFIYQTLEREPMVLVVPIRL